MARIRPRAQTSDDPGTVAGRPLTGAVETPSPEALDDLAGAEAFGPAPEGDPNDPFSHAYVEGGRRVAAGGAGGGPARTTLLVAVAVCVAGLLAVLLGVADDDEEGDGDAVATVATTTSTSRPSSTTSTSARATSTTAAGATTSTTSGFAPGTTPPTTTRATTITTVRPSTTLPQATTTAPNRPLDIRIEVLDQDKAPLVSPLAGQAVIIRVTWSDADAEPTNHCRSITLNGSVLFDDDCRPRSCPSAFAPGGEAVLEFDRTFPTAGDYTFVAELTSGYAECGDRGASEGRDTLQVTVR